MNKLQPIEDVFKELVEDRLKIIMCIADENIKCGRRVQLTKKNQIHHNWYFRLCLGILLKDARQGENVPVLVQGVYK